MILNILAYIGLVAVVVMLLSFVVMIRSELKQHKVRKKRAIIIALISIVIASTSCLTAFALGQYIYVP